MFFEKGKVDQAHRTDLDKNAILKKSKEEREKRQLNKKQQEAAILLQKCMRGQLARKNLELKLRT